MDSFAALRDSLRHISVRTYRASGEPVDTPVWFEASGPCLYFRTIASSAKVARIQANSRVAVAPCTEDGTPVGDFIDASARILTDDLPLLATIDRAMDAKYGAERAAMTSLMRERGIALLYIEIAPTATRHR
jgi:uncharacterized protein